MEYERQERGILLLLCAVVSVISLILFPASESVRKVVADPIVTTVNNTVKINKTNVNNPESNNSLIINNKNGTATYRGLIIFNDGNPTGKLAFINNCHRHIIMTGFLMPSITFLAT